MENTYKVKAIKVILTFIITALVLQLVFVCPIFIPRDNLNNNIAKSAAYMSKGYAIKKIDENKDYTYHDYYADSILLSIVKNFDSKNPLKSLALAEFGKDKNSFQNVSLYEETLGKKIDKEQYIRYWHGSLLFVQPLLLFLDIQGIYKFNAIVLALLFVLLIFRLIRNKEYGLAAAFVFGLWLTKSWMLPISLEYVPTFYVWIISMHCLITMINRGKTEMAYLLFLITGMFTSFVDFLTTETLTLTLPLVVLLYISKKRFDKSNKELLVMLDSYAAIWLVGYAGMWAMKWVYSSIILHENTFKYFKSSIAERLSTDAGKSANGSEMTALGSMIKSLRVNFCTMMAGNSEGVKASIIYTLVAVLVLAIIIYCYKKKSFDWGFLGILSLCGIVPYIRYIVMQNHSIRHFFFTFRAQYITAVVIALIVIEMIEWRTGKNASTKKRRV